MCVPRDQEDDQFEQFEVNMPQHQRRADIFGRANQTVASFHGGCRTVTPHARASSRE
jgi:hypothetical protein